MLKRDREAPVPYRLWLTALCLFCFGSTGSAGDWKFAPSYFSHEDSPGFQGLKVQNRSAYRRPLKNQHHGFAIRGARRWDWVIINSGSSSDRTLIREDWYDVDY